MTDVSTNGTKVAIKGSTRKVEVGVPVPQAKPSEPAPPKKKKDATKAAKTELVAGVRVAKADAKQLDLSLERFELEAGGEAADKIRKLAAFFSRKQKELEAAEFDVCDECGGVCLLEVSGPLLGEVCPYCGDGPAPAEEAVPEPEVRGQAAREPTGNALPVVIAAIDLDGSPAMRAELSADAVKQYAGMLDELPPVELMRVGRSLRVIDGRHRIAAARAEGRAEILAVVREGSERDAFVAALGANARHGVRLSDADLRLVVGAALADAELVQWADRRLARLVGCSHTIVGVIRAECRPESVDEPRVGQDGKRRKAPKPRKAKSPIEQAQAKAKIEQDRDKREAKHPDPDPSEVTVAGRLPLKEEIPLDRQLRGQKTRDNQVVEHYFVRRSNGRPVAIVIERRRAEP